jgi:hypothetical protein
MAKVAVQCSADTYVVNQTLVLRIHFCSENTTFAKPENVTSYKKVRLEVQLSEPWTVDRRL